MKMNWKNIFNFKTKIMNDNELLKKAISLETEAKELRVLVEERNKPRPIMDRVKTFEDALAIYKALKNEEPDLAGTEDEIAYKKDKDYCLRFK